MMWGYDGSGWGPWLGMGFGMIVFWGLIIAGGIALVRYTGSSRDRRESAESGGRGGPEQVLADRFARGEIDEDEYRTRRLLLGEGR